MDKPAAIRISNSFSPEQVEELLYSTDSRARDYRLTKGGPPKAFMELVEKANSMKLQVRRKRLEATRDERSASGPA